MKSRICENGAAVEMESETLEDRKFLRGLRDQLNHMGVFPVYSSLDMSHLVTIRLPLFNRKQIDSIPNSLNWTDVLLK
jgi:hypothetical protein